jgi:hypothetical protein
VGAETNEWARKFVWIAWQSEKSLLANEPQPTASHWVILTQVIFCEGYEAGVCLSVTHEYLNHLPCNTKMAQNSILKMSRPSLSLSSSSSSSAQQACMAAGLPQKPLS